MNNETLETIMETLEKALLKVSPIIPPERLAVLKQDIRDFKNVLLEKRSPRFMLIGRRGAGKSSLINAILGKYIAPTGDVYSKTGRSQYYSYQNGKGTIEILDTRGLGDFTKPESADFQDALKDIKQSIEIKPPDVILFLCKAKDVDSNISVDVNSVLDIQRFIFEKHGFNAPIIGVVTCVDELAPLSDITPPYSNRRKQDNIELAVQAIEKVFQSIGDDVVKVIPTSAYADYDNTDSSKIIDQRYWNIDTLITYLVEVLPSSAHLELVRLSKIHALQISLARKLVGITAAITAGIAAIPIPFSDIFPISATQIGMIMGIAYLSGRDLSTKSATEFITAIGVNIGAGMLLRQLSQALVKIIPVAGSFISAGIAATGTVALGEAAIAYFIESKSIEESKNILNTIKNEKSNQE